MADQKIAAGNKMTAHSLHQFLLGLAIKVNHDISAKNNLEFPVMFIGLGQVQLPETHPLGHLLLHTVVLGPFAHAHLEITPQPFARQVLDPLLRIDRPLGGIQNLCGNIGGCDIPLPSRHRRIKFAQIKTQAVRFLAGGTGSAPYAELLLSRHQQCRQCLVHQELEMLFLAEKTREIGGEGIQHLCELGWIIAVLEIFAVLGQRLMTQRPHALAQTRTDQRFLAVVQSNARLFINKIDNEFACLLISHATPNRNGGWFDAQAATSMDWFSR